MAIKKRFRDATPEQRKEAADLLRGLRRRARGEVETPPLPLGDPQHEVGAQWVASEGVETKIEEALQQHGPEKVLPVLKKLAASTPSSQRGPFLRAIEREERRKGALATTEKKRSKSGFATREQLREVVAHVDRAPPKPRQRNEAIRRELVERKLQYPAKKNFSRWLKANLK